MHISVFDLLSIGIGPSSSHTIGPMRAAYRFLDENSHLIDEADGVVVNLYGSLALTGKGHCTDLSSMLGLSGYLPESIEPEEAATCEKYIVDNETLKLFNKKDIRFVPSKHIVFNMDITLPEHANGIKFTLFNSNKVLAEETFFSVGGGFIVSKNEMNSNSSSDSINENNIDFPHKFETYAELYKICKSKNLSITQVMMENELCLRSETEIKDGILKIWKVMHDSIDRGLCAEGNLPGALSLPRRAKKLHEKIKGKNTPAKDFTWLNVFAIAVNEENGAGGKVVTAPTNGSSGLMPAVMKYFMINNPDYTEQNIIDFILVCCAIGILYKKGASISAAEVGCQGEIGVACSMAAGAYAHLIGGSIEQISQAAEIGMEHNLGLTCDPLSGLVQIPCIERNAVGSVQAVNAAQIALLEEGNNYIDLDKVIRTMFVTGKDMHSKYKETSLGGLAVNLANC